MKVVWNTCDKELGREMKSTCENYSRSSLKNFLNSLPFRETYIKYLEKSSIKVYFLAILLSFDYQFPIKSKACDKHSIYS